MLTARKMSSICMTRSRSSSKTPIILYCISILSTSNPNYELNCSCTYVMVTLIRCTMQKVGKTWISLAHAAGLQPFFNIVSSYLRSDHTKTYLGYF